MSTGFETQTQNDKTGKRSAPGEVHENREKGDREEGPRTAERLGLSQGTVIREPRYGWRGHTPKYQSCRV